MRELFWTRARMSALEETTFVTQDFSWVEVGSAPGRRVGGAAVEAPATNTIAQLRRCIVGVNNMRTTWLSRVGRGWDCTGILMG